MRKISVNPKRIKNKIPSVDDSIAFDDQRRLRNALIALEKLDPGWMVWVEQNISRKAELREQRQLVERQARILMIKGYSFLWHGFTEQVIDADIYFTDTGDLKAYR